MTDVLPAQPLFQPNEYLVELQTGRAQAWGEVPFEKTLDALRTFLEDELGSKDESEYLARKYAAIIGDMAAKQHFLERIHDFLRKNPGYQNTHYPSYYPDLAEALFQHQIGFGPMSVWFAHPTESATVNGTQILFGVPGHHEKLVQPFEFDSLDQVKRLIRTLTLTDANNQVNQTSTWTQVDMLNGTRVTIFAPPLAETYTLVFRQYLFTRYTFEHEADVGTVGRESVAWWRLLSRLMLSMLTTGVRRSGKTTFLKVIYEARDPELDIVTVERGTFEAHLRRDFPKRAAHIFALKSPLEDMNSLFPAFLRTDAHYIMVPEIRSMEVDLAIQSRERGGGWLGSYHGQYVLNIPLELANLSLEIHPNRNHRSTYIRAVQSLDVVITMWEDSTGRKIVTGVYAYEYDHEKEAFTVTTWAKYRRETDDWSYHCDIPPQMDARLRETHPEVYHHFLDEFHRLAEDHPLVGQATQTVRIGG